MMEKIHKLELCILDMDGLLLNTERAAFDAHMQAARLLYIPYKEEHYKSVIGMKDSEEEQYMQVLFPHADAREFLNLSAQIKHEFEETHGVEIKPGVYTLLDYLETRGIPAVVATSTYDVRAEKLLKAADIYHRLQNIIYGNMVSKSKPAPDIFLKALEVSGMNDSRKAVVFEDSHLGIEAANSADIPVIMVPDLLPPPTNLTCLAVFESIDLAIPLLETL